MVKYCVAYGCKELQKTGSGIQFHKFPFSRPEILKKWIHAVRREKWKPSMSSTLCSQHFLEDCYQVRPGVKVKLLKEDAVPSVFDFPVHLQKKTSVRRPLLRLEPSNAIDKEADFDMEVERLESPSKQKCQQTQTDPVPQSPTKAILRKKIKLLQMRLNRRNKKIGNMAELIEELKKKGHSNSDLETVLEENFSGFPFDFIKNQFHNSQCAKNGSRYSDLVKQFSLTLHFYSPKAYKYVRSLFSLPHPNRLRSWISSVNCEPGFIGEVFKYLNENSDKVSHLKECALIFDGMSIRKQLVWDASKKRLSGYVDLGGIASTEVEELAKEALVFQIVSYSKKFKCPVAYFFINKVSSAVLSQLLRTCLMKLSEVGVTVRSITCDGARVNIQALQLLGCEFSGNKVVSHFKHPDSECEIYVMLDACHMLKLARNTLADKRIMQSVDGEVNWKYVEKLHLLQEKEGLKFANKISACHVNFSNKKMNVSLAAQTLSSGVADAIEFLDKSNHPDFHCSEATVSFIRKIDKLFDMLNARNIFGKGYKQPLKLENISYCQNFFDEMHSYLRSITIDGIPVLLHPRKTFALGFIVCMQSIEFLVTEFLFRHTEPFQYFLTYKMSQDHLELLFSCIRGKGGWNNNPNTQQFKGALKSLLLKNSISASDNSNVIDLEATNQFAVAEFRSSKRLLVGNDESYDDGLDLFHALQSTVLNEYINNIVYYIGGYIVKKLLKITRCSECIKLLIQPEKTRSNSEHSYCKTPLSDPSSFTKMVSRGGSICPSDSVFRIVQCTEKHFRLVERVSDFQTSKMYGSFINSVCTFIILNFKNYFCGHSINSAIDCEDLHETRLLKEIVSVYTTLRLRAVSRNVTINEHGKRSSVRQKLNKLVTFMNV